MYKNLFHEKKAVLFDLDGTVIDSSPHWQTAFNNSVRQFDIPAIGVYEADYGLSTTESLENRIKGMKQKPELGVPELEKMIEDEFKKVIAELEEPLTYREGFTSFATELRAREIKTGLVSNSPKRVVDFVFETIPGLEDFFDLVVTRDDVRKGKPDPEIYSKASHLLKIKPHNILVFEDSVVGAISSTKAKMDTVIIWGQIVPQDDYPKGIKEFFLDFEGLEFLMDETVKEYFIRLNEQNLTDDAEIDYDKLFEDVIGPPGDETLPEEIAAETAEEAQVETPESPQQQEETTGPEDTG